MIFTCGGTAAKIFGRSVQALAKIGEEIVITSKADGLTIQAANTARSAFGSYSFERNFFAQVDSAAKPFTAIVNTKGGILMAFRFTSNFERTVDECELDFKPEALFVRFRCKSQIQKVYKIDLIDGHNFVYNVDLEKYPNFIKGPARLFLDVVSQFHSKVTEVTLAVTADKLTLRNNLDESENPVNAMQSHVTFERREFDIFEVPLEAMDITFSLKTFKTILNYSEGQQLNVEIHYDRPGAHVIVTLTSDALRDVHIVFVFATLDESTPDVVQESRASQPLRNELSIRPVAKNTTALQKITSQFEKDDTIREAKRPRVDESDDDFDDLLESEELNQIISQKEQEARELLNRTSQESEEQMDTTIVAEGSQDDDRPKVTAMAQILLQNHVKAKRGLLRNKVLEQETEILVPASDDDD